MSHKDMWDLLIDNKNVQATLIAPRLIEALKGYKGKVDLVQILRDWNYQDHIDEVAPSIYHTLYEELIDLILSDELPDEVEEAYWSQRYYWNQRLDSIMLNNHPFIDNKTTPDSETLEKLIVQAADQTIQKLTTLFGPNPQQWKWGKLHTVNFFSPLRPKGFGSEFLGAEVVPKNGSNETINRGAYLRDDTQAYEVEWFSSFRMVADLDDPEKIRGVVAGGSAARVFHPNYKSQLEPWKNETWIPYWFTKEKVLEHSAHLLTLD